VSHRVALFAEQDEVGPAEISALWKRETGMPDDEVERRLHEVLFVALLDGEVVGISSTFLQRNDRLRMDLWHYRVYVVESQRRTHAALDLMQQGLRHLEEQFTSGRDRRAAGVMVVVEGQELLAINRAIWRRTGLVFVGENDQGFGLRVRYFPGALAPEP
jgi:hypothetical protein